MSELSIEELLGLMRDYADTHSSFDVDFLDSICDAYEEYGDLTDAQESACVNIVKRFRMEKWAEERDK